MTQQKKGVADEALGRFARQQHDWFERVRKVSLDPEKVAKAIQKIIDGGKTENKNKYSKVISPILDIPASNSKKVIAEVKAKEIFSYVGPDFKSWDVDEEDRPVEEAKVVVREMTKCATFSKMFGELLPDVAGLCLAPGQILSFLLNHKEWLRISGLGTYFLFKSHDNFFLANVRLDFSIRLRLYIYGFGLSHVQDPKRRLRLVVPAFPKL